MPEGNDLRKLILSEAHDMAYSIHPGSTKMYYDLKERFWWPGIEAISRRVCGHLRHMSACEDRASEASQFVAAVEDSRVEMGGDHDGFHSGIASYS